MASTQKLADSVKKDCYVAFHLDDKAWELYLVNTTSNLYIVKDTSFGMSEGEAITNDKHKFIGGLVKNKPAKIDASDIDELGDYQIFHYLEFIDKKGFAIFAVVMPSVLELSKLSQKQDRIIGKPVQRLKLNLHKQG